MALQPALAGDPHACPGAMRRGGESSEAGASLAAEASARSRTILGRSAFPLPRLSPKVSAATLAARRLSGPKVGDRRL